MSCNDSDQLLGGDEDSSVDEMTPLLFSQSQEGPSNRDPAADDPVFSSEEEMRRYLIEIGQKDVFISPENVEIEDYPDKQTFSCTCGHCTDLEKDQQEYLCCNQLFDWKDLVTDKEIRGDILCVTKSLAYISSVNSFAVKGE